MKTSQIKVPVEEFVNWFFTKGKVRVTINARPGDMIENVEDVLVDEIVLDFNYKGNDNYEFVRKKTNICEISWDIQHRKRWKLKLFKEVLSPIYSTIKVKNGYVLIDNVVDFLNEQESKKDLLWHKLYDFYKNNIKIKEGGRNGKRQKV